MIHTNIWLNVVKFFHCLDPRNVDLCPPGYGTNWYDCLCSTTTYQKIAGDGISRRGRGREEQRGLVSSEAKVNEVYTLRTVKEVWEWHFCCEMLFQPRPSAE